MKLKHFIALLMMFIFGSLFLSSCTLEFDLGDEATEETPEEPEEEEEVIDGPAISVTYHYLNKEKTKKYKQNEPLTDKFIPDVDGYRLLGWYLDEELITKYEGTPIGNDIDLYASMDEGVVKIYCHVDYKITTVYTDALGYPSKLPNKEVSRFWDLEGWYLDQEFTKPLDLKEVLTKNIDVYAKVTKKKYTITYVNEYLNTTKEVEYEAGTRLYPENPESIDNGTFNGWYESEYTTNNETYSWGWEIDSNLTLYAQYYIYTYNTYYYASDYADKSLGTSNVKIGEFKFKKFNGIVSNDGSCFKTNDYIDVAITDECAEIYISSKIDYDGTHYSSYISCTMVKDEKGRSVTPGTKMYYPSGYSSNPDIYYYSWYGYSWYLTKGTYRFVYGPKYSYCSNGQALRSTTAYINYMYYAKNPYKYMYYNRNSLDLSNLTPSGQVSYKNMYSETKNMNIYDNVTLSQSNFAGEASFIGVNNEGSVKLREAYYTYSNNILDYNSVNGIELDGKGLYIDMKARGQINITLYAANGTARFGLIAPDGKYMYAYSGQKSNESINNIPVKYNVNDVNYDDTGTYEIEKNKTVSFDYSIKKAGRYYLYCPTGATNNAIIITSLSKNDLYQEYSKYNSNEIAFNCATVTPVNQYTYTNGHSLYYPSYENPDHNSIFTSYDGSVLNYVNLQGSLSGYTDITNYNVYLRDGKSYWDPDLCMDLTNPYGLEIRGEEGLYFRPYNGKGLLIINIKSGDADKNAFVKLENESGEAITAINNTEQIKTGDSIILNSAGSTATASSSFNGTYCVGQDEITLIFEISNNNNSYLSLISNADSGNAVISNITFLTRSYTDYS